VSVSWKGEVALIVEWRKGIEEKDTADVSCIRERKKEQKRSREESETGSTGVKQKAQHVRHKLDSTPPPLRRTGGSSSPPRWEVLFNLFLNDLTRDGGFLDNEFDSSCLGTVDPDRGRELNWCGNSCNTGVCWSGSAKNW